MVDDDIRRDIQAIQGIEAVPVILEAVTRTTGMRFAAVARVTGNRWVACAVRDDIGFGLVPGGELEVASTICDEIRVHRQPVVFSQASKDERWRAHHTPLTYGLESYISVPIIRDSGDFFGTLCAIDPLPASLDDPNILRTLELFAQLIATQLDMRERLEQSNTALVDAQDTARLRDQFMALVGHDLRSPLSAIRLGTDLLRTTTVDARAERTLALIDRSCARMVEMIDNILDFARGRLGGGIPVRREPCADLADVLQHVVEETAGAFPSRKIQASFDIAGEVTCDAPRLAQLLANLVHNALSYGQEDTPVHVDAAIHEGSLELAVTNEGAPIPEEKLARLFQPFTRGSGESRQPGLGLGLYIASEIARGHGGKLEFKGASGTNRFVLTIPST
jgi:signal transduction histidine kinase